MANPFDVDEAASRLQATAQSGDGISSARILEEAGSCEWKSLIAKVNQKQDGYKFELSTHSELLPDRQMEKLSVFKRGIGYNYFPIIPHATVSDQRCEKK